jgi:hypothetical protein
MRRPIELVLRAGDLEVPLTVGTILPARVLGVGRDSVVWLAGVRVRAIVPADAEVGEEVRVRVTQADPARVVLQVMRDAPPDGPALIDVRA